MTTANLVQGGGESSWKKKKKKNERNKNHEWRSVRIMLLDYMLTCGALDGSRNIAVFIQSNGII